MIRVYSPGTSLDDMRLSNGLCTLNEATDICISQEINATPVLTFSLPTDVGKWKFLRQGYLILCEGQIYKIYKKARKKSGATTREVKALHIVSEAGQKLLLTFPKQIGKTPRHIMTVAFSDTEFNVTTHLPNGMEWVDTPTDFLDDLSKVTPLKIVKTLIEKNGEGELYIDNYNIALVKKLVSNAGTMNVSTKFNAKSIADEEDGSDIVTRLYPFGKNDMPLSGELPYIDSPLLDVIGLREGYREYKDVTDPEILLQKAEYEFSEDNPKRIDMPNLSYNISLVDLYKLYGDSYKIGLGDSLKITDYDLEIDTVQRVVKSTYYPYSTQNSSVTLGNPPKSFSETLKSIVSSEEKFSNALNGSGVLKASFIENLLKNKSEYITDALAANEVTVHKTGDLWCFEDDAGNRGAIAIVDGQLAISDTKNADGTWVWTTFIDGKSVTADVINSGTLNTDLIELKSTYGETYLHGNEFKMVAEDGAMVSIRASDGKNGLKKGLQIIEQFYADGTPKNYSIYDSNGYRRYIDGNRVQTYSIASCGFCEAHETNTDTIYQLSLQCAGEYFYKFATAYNAKNTNDAMKQQMFQWICNNVTTNSTNLPLEFSNLKFVEVRAVNKGDHVQYRDGSTSYFIIAERGAVFIWTALCYKRIDRGTYIDHTGYIPEAIAYVNTTMDVEGLS
ncbi:MAG: phage tail protein [Clostridia bacterium]|nr:phage tail protein [Clostridia bacterium]